VACLMREASSVEKRVTGEFCNISAPREVLTSYNIIYVAVDVSRWTSRRAHSLQLSCVNAHAGIVMACKRHSRKLETEIYVCGQMCAFTTTPDVCKCNSGECLDCVRVCES